MQIEVATFAAGDFLFQEGEKSFHFYIIQEGQVEVFKKGAQGQVLPLAIAQEGAALGELAMVDRQPRSASARALTTVQAARISEEAYQQLLAELPDWAQCVLSSLVDRLRQTSDIVRRHGIVDDSIKRQIESIEFSNAKKP